MAVMIDQLEHDAVPMAPAGSATASAAGSGQSAATHAAMLSSVRRANVREASRRARLWAD